MANLVTKGERGLPGHKHRKGPHPGDLALLEQTREIFAKNFLQFRWWRRLLDRRIKRRNIELDPIPELALMLFKYYENDAELRESLGVEGSDVFMLKLRYFVAVALRGLLSQYMRVLRSELIEEKSDGAATLYQSAWVKSRLITMQKYLLRQVRRSFTGEEDLRIPDLHMLAVIALATRDAIRVVASRHSELMPLFKHLYEGRENLLIQDSGFDPTALYFSLADDGEIEPDSSMEGFLIPRGRAKQGKWGYEPIEFVYSTTGGKLVGFFTDDGASDYFKPKCYKKADVEKLVNKVVLQPLGECLGELRKKLEWDDNDLLRVEFAFQCARFYAEDELNTLNQALEHFVQRGHLGQFVNNFTNVREQQMVDEMREGKHCDFVTLSRAAEILGVSQTWVRTMVEEKMLHDVYYTEHTGKKKSGLLLHVLELEKRLKRKEKRGGARSEAPDVIEREGARYLTVKAASEYSGYKESYIRQLINMGKVKVVRDSGFGKRVRVEEESLMGYMESVAQSG